MLPIFDAIKDSGFPHVILSGEDSVLPWKHGEAFSARQSSLYQRFSVRGWQRVAAWTTFDQNFVFDDRGWNRETCAYVQDALCRDSHGQLWFPDGKVDVPDRFGRLPMTPIIALVNQTATCRDTGNGRELSIGDDRYEVSLCDLLGLNLDVVQVGNSLYWRQDHTPLLEFFILAIFSIFIVACLSQRISDMFELARKMFEIKNKQELPNNNLDQNNQNNQNNQKNQKNDHSLHHTLHHTKTYTRISEMLGFEDVAAFIAWTYILITFSILEPEALISTQDRILFKHLIVYIPLAQICHVALKNNAAIPGRHISLLSASLILISIKVHNSFDNPYTIFLAIIFGWRASIKIFLCPCHAIHIVWTLIDVLAFFSIVSNGVAPQHSTRIEAVMTCTSISIVSSLLGLLTAQLFR